MSILAEIARSKRSEVEEARARKPLAEVKAEARRADPPRGFRRALLLQESIGLIAEVKRASPSQGLIRADFDPAQIARACERAGARCLSVLTDQPYFQGRPQDLMEARAATSLPSLRKDFILDPYQVYEARAWGADAILLIVAMLRMHQLRDLHLLACDLGMDVLVEVHGEHELDYALRISTSLIGVNNRDLATFKVDLGVSRRLLPMLPEGVAGVSESGIESAADVEAMQAAGARAVLIGTAFCAAPDIEARVREVMGW